MFARQPEWREAVSFKAGSVPEDSRAQRAKGGECDGSIGTPGSRAWVAQ